MGEAASRAGVADHRLILPPKCPVKATTDPAEYADLLTELAWDHEVTLGRAGWNDAIDLLSQFGYPDSDIAALPKQFAKECQKAINRILGRNPEVPSQEHAVDELTAKADLDESARAAEHDLGSCIKGTVGWYLSLAHLWSDRPPEGEIGRSRGELPLVASSKRDDWGAAREKAESREQLRSKFCKRVIVVYGGHPSDAAVGSIAKFFEVQAADIEWHPSEKKQRPRNFKERIANLKAENSLVLLLTGAIGHTNSIPISKACKARGVPVVFVEDVSGFRDDFLAQLAS